MGDQQTLRRGRREYQCETGLSSEAGVAGRRGSSSANLRILRSSVRVLMPRSWAARWRLPAGLQQALLDCFTLQVGQRGARAETASAVVRLAPPDFQRQVIQLDHFPVGHDHHTLQQVAQLTNVARPVVMLE